MRLYRPGFLAGFLYPEALFRIKTTAKVLYLTFDDGPDPVSSPKLLDILGKFHVGATFFCNGSEAEKYPDLMNEIRKRGYLIGNHGYDHRDGWKTNPMDYINDVNRASQFTSDKMFRPPYGRLSMKQKKLLRSFKIVLWDIIAYDFDKAFGSRRSLGKLKNKIRPGSIIVLHDTALSCANEILDEFIVFALGKGYRFDMIPDFY
jgi:peptidoglycan-N-acetylglucosamine deacetylase